MAQEIVGVKIEVGGGEQIGKSLGSLKSQLREAQADVAALSEKFGATSKEAINAAKRAAELKDAIGDAKALTDAFNPDAKFKALTASLSGVAGGFAAVQGAMGLIGSESKDVEKMLLKVQSAMALSQGLQALGESVDSFKQLKVVALDAFKSIRAAIGSTGIGLFVIALGTIVAYWDKIAESISGVSEELSNATKLASDKTKMAEKELKVLDLQVNSLKLQGKTEKEILNIRIQKTEALIKDSEIELALIQKTGLAQIEKYTSIRKLAQSVLGAAGTGIADVILGGAIEDTQTKYQERKDFIDKALSDLDGFRLQVNAINKKEDDDRKRRNKEIQDERQKRDELFLEKIKGANIENADPRIQREVTYESFVTDMSKRLINGAVINSAILKQIDDTTTTSILNNAKNLADGKLALNKAIQESTTALIDVIGRDTATGKGLAIAQATINTYLGASEVIKAKNIYPEPYGTAVKAASVAAILLNGFKQVKGITATQVPKYGGSSISNISSAAPISPAAPIQTTLTQLNANTINQMGNMANRAYVIESDVTNNQERIKRINRAARLN